MYAHTCCYLMMSFKLMKLFYFSIFHVHKNSNLNHFNSILKEAIFRVLQLHLEGMPFFLSLYYQGGTDHLCGGRYVKQEGFSVAWRN